MLLPRAHSGPGGRGRGGVLDIVTIGGVQRTANAGQVAAIAVIKAEVPGATARVMRALQASVGAAVACAAAALPLIQDLARNACAIIMLMGVSFGLALAYVPVPPERDRIQRKATQAGAEAGSFMANACSLQ